MIVTVFIRRLKEGRTFDDFLVEWGAEQGFGVPTRVINAVSAEDPRDILSIGFVDIGAADLQTFLADAPASEAKRHARIDTVIESIELRAFYDLRTEHDLTDVPIPVEIGSAQSLFAALAG